MAFKRILVPLDGSQLSEEALPHARRLARVFDAQVVLLHVLRTQPSAVEACADSVDWRLHRLEILSYLKRLAEQFSQQGIETKYHTTEGRPAEQVVEFACENDIDLMVLSAYGWGGVTQFPFGSTVHKILSVPCASQLVIRPGQPVSADAGYRRILVPVDGSQRAEWAAGLAATVARAQNAELILLQVVAVPEMLRRTPMTPEELRLRNQLVDLNRTAAERYLAELANRLQNGARIRQHLLVSPTVGSAIQHLAEQEHVDLIALSAHGGSECADSSGSVCRSILLHSQVPVLVFQDQPQHTINEDQLPHMESRGAQTVYGM
jgi:nucleotide-binding universal stress UspA family protein